MISLDTLRSDTRSIFICTILYHIWYNFGQSVTYITDCLFVYITKYTKYYINTSVKHKRENRRKTNTKLKYKNNTEEYFIFSSIIIIYC